MRYHDMIFLCIFLLGYAKRKSNTLTLALSADFAVSLLLFQSMSMYNACEETLTFTILPH
jgi:hypothetical protein